MDRLAGSHRPVTAAIRPLAVYSWVFASVPLAMRDARDFVRTRLRHTRVAEPQIDTVDTSVSKALHELTADDVSVHISVRVFTDYVEVDVLHSATRHPPPLAAGEDGLVEST